MFITTTERNQSVVMQFGLHHVHSSAMVKSQNRHCYPNSFLPSLPVKQA
jgi:hypothetical protein